MDIFIFPLNEAARIQGSREGSVNGRWNECFGCPVPGVALLVHGYFRVVFDAKR